MLFIPKLLFFLSEFSLDCQCVYLMIQRSKLQSWSALKLRPSSYSCPLSLILSPTLADREEYNDREGKAQDLWIWFCRKFMTSIIISD